jgi:hypothetical protein
MMAASMVCRSWSVSGPVEVVASAEPRSGFVVGFSGWFRVLPSRAASSTLASAAITVREMAQVRSAMHSCQEP